MHIIKKALEEILNFAKKLNNYNLIKSTIYATAGSLKFELPKTACAGTIVGQVKLLHKE